MAKQAVGLSKVRVNSQMTGMQGVYMVAAELTRRSLIVSPTSRSSYGADLLVTDQGCKRAWSVQVKTNAGHPNFWLLNKHCGETKSASHIYVLVNLGQKKPQREPVFYIVPSRVLATKMHQSTPRGEMGSIFYLIYRDDILRYKGRWRVFRGASQT